MKNNHYDLIITYFKRYHLDQAVCDPDEASNDCNGAMSRHRSSLDVSLTFCARVNGPLAYKHDCSLLQLQRINITILVTAAESIWKFLTKKFQRLALTFL